MIHDTCGRVFMKVTIIADVLGEENNGTTTACMNLVRYLQDCGDEVKIVCCDADKKGWENYYIVKTFSMGPLINKIIERNNVALANPETAVIEEAIKDADIVHIMMPFALGRKAVKLAKKRNIPVTSGFHVQAENFTSHIGMMNFGLANYVTYMTFYETVYKKMNGIHYPTQFIRDLFENTVRHKTNGYVISNGVHDRFKKKNSVRPEELKDKFVILFTGRYSREKSHHILIKAVAKSKYKDKIQLIFAGQGPNYNALRKLSIKKNINMPIMKFFDKDELAKVINYCDLYCHPAEIEIEAIACLEAISCGIVPVIANSKRCATKAFAIDEKNLFKCNDTQDLADKIDYWIEHPEERKQRSKEYLSYTKQFNQTECMKKMRLMMEECIRNN